MVNPRKNRLSFSSPRPTIAMVAGVGLLLGVAAAYASESLADNRPAMDSSTTPASLATLDSDMERLARRLKTLQARVAARPEPRSSPDLSVLKSKLDDLARSAEAVPPLVKQVTALDERVGAIDTQVADLRDQVGALKAKIGKTAPR